VVRATFREGVTRRRFTAEEFERIAETGIFDVDPRIELLDGELLEMAPIGAPHVLCVMRLTNIFPPKLAGRALISVQSSFRLTDSSEPQPDLIIIRNRDYGNALPRAEDVLLVIEVSDTSLRYDRDDKLPRYAAAGIPEVWIADVARKQLTAYRSPSPDGYRQVLTLTRHATISPLAFPDIELRWEDIFGKV
jgi:Uma2 family endonuclease